ncbi:MAG: flagellar biosynthetic protein FliQ [Pseudomonadota bacterium]
MRQGLWVSVLMSTPILGVALATGLAIGLFQALTSIQEMTLTFVPKLLAMVAVFWATMAFMTELLTAFFRRDIVPAILAS